MTEHMNDQGTCYCGSLDCLGNVRAMLSEAQVKLFETRAGAEQVEAGLAFTERELAQVKAERDNLVRTITMLRGELDEAKGWLKDARLGWSGSDSEFTEYYGELCEMLDVELTETVEVEIELRQTIRVKKPIGTDIDESDFYTRSYVEIYANSDEVEVIEHTDDASISDVSVN